MAKLVVNIKGQSEEFGLTDDARDIGGNDYLTISDGNKKQYARLGSNATKLIVRKNNQKFYVQKDPILFTDKKLITSKYNFDYVYDVFFPKGVYIVKRQNKYQQFIINKQDVYRVIVNMYRSNDTDYFIYTTIVNNGNYILNKKIFLSPEKELLIVRND